MKFVRIILIIVLMGLCFVVGVGYERLAGNNVVPPFPLDIGNKGAAKESSNELKEDNLNEAGVLDGELPAVVEEERIESDNRESDNTGLINEVPIPLAPEENSEVDLINSSEDQFIENVDFIGENRDIDGIEFIPDAETSVSDQGIAVEIPKNDLASDTNGLAVPSVTDAVPDQQQPIEQKQSEQPANPVSPDKVIKKRKSSEKMDEKQKQPSKKK
ncbi:MAG: hypothetical protein LBI29_00930 [Rickettsiales bacterium]|jgi:hypothetical protein|nr:hypothetical protein [Rickettsiales bacterium]